MNVITVIPISRGIGKETLSYFTSSAVELGSLVEVPLRKKFVEGLVIEIKDVRSMKSQLKTADFSLRKVEKLVSRPFVPAAFMKTVEEVAQWHAATVGATLKVMLPKKNLMGIGSRSSRQHDSAESAMRKTKEEFFPVRVFKGTLTERIEHYKKELAKNTMVIIVVPTKERQDTLKKQFDVPILLPSAIIEIPLGTSLIIIEEATSQAYKSMSRPFVDFRFALEKYAQCIGADIIKGVEGLDPKVKKIVEEHKKEEGVTFSSIGKELENDIKKLRESPVHLFILGTRKGHSGTVLCQDCSHVFRCTRCDAPLTLHLKSAKEDFNTMLCHHCGYKTTARTGCPICGGWRLKAYGLGIEKIEEDVQALIKKFRIKPYIQRIDSTLKLTPKHIRDFLKTHYEKPCSILIGTELLLPYLANMTLEDKRNNASYIASLDTLLSLPDFSINEKIWKTLSILDDITEMKVVIQTRNVEHPLLDAWKKGDGEKFWKQELEDRKQFNYPPHGVLIKISIKGRKDMIGREMKKIETLLQNFKPMVFPAFIKAIKNQHILHALITLPKDRWVDEELLTLLRSLPPSVTIEVNPRSLL